MWNSRENVTLYFALSFLYIKYVQLYKPFTGHMRFDSQHTKPSFVKRG